jgi:DNA-binding transcriptional LysR family regulator
MKGTPLRFEQPDFHLLRVFLTVVECGSFRAAQSRLGCRASTVSMNMKKLETKLGFSLCQRGRAGLVLTPSGELVLDAARRLVTASNEYGLAVTRARGRAFGEVKLCLCDVLRSDENFSLSDIIGHFIEVNPNLHLSVDVLAPTEIERHVLDGHYDIGIAPSFHSYDGLVYEPLIPESHLLVCWLGHPYFASDAEVVNKGLASTPSLLRSYLTAASRRSIPFSGQVAAQVNSIEASLLLIRTGRYVGYLPEQIAKPYIHAGVMREVSPEARYVSTVFTIYKKSHLSPHVRALVGRIMKLQNNVAA